MNTMTLLGLRHGAEWNSRDSAKAAYNKARRKLRKDDEWVLRKFVVLEDAAQSKAMSTYLDCAQAYQGSLSLRWRVPVAGINHFEAFSK